VAALAREQAGVVSRRQLIALGLSPAQARTELDTGRWQSLHVGVYATFTGPVPPLAALWAALLRAGPGAVAGPRSSLWLSGLLDRPPSPFDIDIPATRRVELGDGVTMLVRRHSDLDRVRHPVASPPRLRIGTTTPRARAVNGDTATWSIRTASLSSWTVVRHTRTMRDYAIAGGTTGWLRADERPFATAGARWRGIRVRWRVRRRRYCPGSAGPEPCAPAVRNAGSLSDRWSV